MKKHIFIIYFSLALAFSCFFPAYQAVAAPPQTSTPYLVGKWLPSDQAFFDQWLAKVVEDKETADAPLSPVIQEFKELIEEDAQLYQLFNQMFDQVPKSSSFRKNPSGNPQIKNYRQMLLVMNRGKRGQSVYM